MHFLLLLLLLLKSGDYMTLSHKVTEALYRFIQTVFCTACIDMTNMTDMLSNEKVLMFLVLA